MTLYTIGHSTLPIARFISLLHRRGITAICDVRSSPYSRANPQFSKDELRLALAQADIAYVFLGKELGARPTDPTCFDGNKAAYERIAATALFKKGLQRVRAGTERYTVALMCAEKDPITCHRTILVARYLADLGVEHILTNGNIETHDDALLRLVRNLGVKADVDAMRPAIVDAAYRIQGDRICYRNEKLTADRPVKHEEAPRFI